MNSHKRFSSKIKQKKVEKYNNLNNYYEIQKFYISNISQSNFQNSILFDNKLNQMLYISNFKNILYEIENILNLSSIQNNNFNQNEYFILSNYLIKIINLVNQNKSINLINKNDYSKGLNLINIIIDKMLIFINKNNKEL
jgi:hypothetical protein